MNNTSLEMWKRISKIKFCARTLRRQQMQSEMDPYKKACGRLDERVEWANIEQDGCVAIKYKSQIIYEEEDTAKLKEIAERYTYAEKISHVKGGRQVLVSNGILAEGISSAKQSRKSSQRCAEGLGNTSSNGFCRNKWILKKLGELGNADKPLWEGLLSNILFGE